MEKLGDKMELYKDVNSGSVIKDDDSLVIDGSSYEINLQASKYSPETEIIGYIDSVFKGIENSLMGINRLISMANNYISKNNDIGNNVSIPEILGINLSYDITSDGKVNAMENNYIKNGYITAR